MADLIGKIILVVEDEVLIGMAIEDVLLEAGATVIGPCASVADTMKALDQFRVDGASLDWTLRGETSEPIATRLLAERVPYVFLTGNPPDEILARFPSAGVVSKPHFNLGFMVDVLARRIAAGRS